MRPRIGRSLGPSWREHHSTLGHWRTLVHYSGVRRVPPLPPNNSRTRFPTPASIRILKPSRGLWFCGYDHTHIPSHHTPPPPLHKLILLEPPPPRKWGECFGESFTGSTNIHTQNHAIPSPLPAASSPSTPLLQQHHDQQRRRRQQQSKEKNKQSTPTQMPCSNFFWSSFS